MDTPSKLIETEADRLLAGLDLDDDADIDRARLRLTAYIDAADAIRAEAADRLARFGPEDPRTVDMVRLAHIKLDIHLAATNRVRAHLGLPIDPAPEPGG